LERCIFKHRKKEVYLVADAYRGRRIKQAVIDFLNAASGKSKDKDTVSLETNTRISALNIHGDSNLIVYVGHDGLMDFTLENYPKKQDGRHRETIILACFSKMYFHEAVVRAGAKPLLWTTGLMAPEAYTLESALEGWVLGEDARGIRLRAAKAYNKYQKCGLKAAKRLLVNGM
jgi:hypothetical protein